MEKIDTFFLEKFQKLSDWFQVWTGYNNFHLAKFFLTIGFAFFVETQIQNILYQGYNFSSVSSVIIGTLVYFYITYRIRLGEKNCHQNPVFKSELALSFRPFRRLSVYILIVGTVVTVLVLFFHPEDNGETFEQITHEKLKFIFLYLASIMEFVTFYLASCTPKPKKPSKLKELFRRKKYFLQLQPKTV